MHATLHGQSFKNGCFKKLCLSMVFSNISQKAWISLLWNTEVFVASFIFMRPFIVCVYSFVEHDHAEKNAFTNRRRGFVTPETWGCAARKRGVKNAGTICSDIKSARWLTVPEVVLGTIMLGLTIWARIQVGKMRKGGLGNKNSRAELEA